MARGLAILAGAAVALALLPASVMAVPAVTGEFPVPNMPRYLTQGPDGNMWVAYGNTQVSRITPAGVVTTFDPNNIDTIGGITSANGKLWTTNTTGIGSFSPSDPDNTGDQDPVTGVGGEAIARGSDGSLWTTGTDTVFKINPATNPVGSTPITVADLSGRDVDAANGFVWVADASAPGRVIRLTNGGVVTPFTTGGMVQGVAAGPGTDAAYADQGAPQHVGRIQGGVVKKTNRPGDPFGITLGSDGAYWTALFNSNPFSLGRLTVGGALTTLGTFSGGPRQIAAGPGNTLWVSLEQVNKVARVSGVTAPAPAGGGSSNPGKIFNGTAGNDTINGTPGDDVINCGAGNDVVNGGGGSDLIRCGSGRDRIRGGAGNDRIDGGSGNDRVSGDSGRDVINGSTGNDRLAGNSNGDRVRGGSGNDRVGGSSGNDRVAGDKGNDKVAGDSGNDRVAGDSGKDRVSGGRGNDRVAGGSGNDRVAGDSGRDRVSGGSGNDRLSGGSGNDRLIGGRGRDRLSGGSGRDRESQ